MRTWPIGLSTGCFYQRNILEVLDAVRNSGFREIEICSFPLHLDYHREDLVKQVAQRIKDLDMVPFSFHAPFADRIDITSFDAGIREAAVKELIVACRAAATLGVQHVVLHPGPERTGRPPSYEFLEHMNHAAKSLDQVAKVCVDLGIQLLLENMLPHLLFGKLSDMMFLLGEIQESNVGACLDTGHANLAGELGGTVHTLSGHLKMLHVNDNRRDSDAHLPPGEGTIDWEWLVFELDRYQFNGSLILELHGHAHESLDQILGRATRARAYLEELMRKVP